VSTRVDIEEIESTKSEKLLAVVLAIFLLIGGIWTYQKIDDYVADAIGYGPVQLEPADRAALQRLASAQGRLGQARQAEFLARDRLEISREAYRTALDEGRQAPALEREYRDAQADFELRQAEREEAQAAVAAARPAAQKARQEESREFREREDRRALLSAVFRLVFVLAFVAVAYWLLNRLRKRGSRYFPLALALVATAAVLAFVMAADYITDYVDPIDLGPLVLSLFGIALTLAAFAALQRYLARRIPVRRVRKHECPFCGYPVRENEHCEGCGRLVIGECSNCAQPRRVGALHCGACGHA
jgi:ABC-type multidrug transport system fused ATPase/permease subunit